MLGANNNQKLRDFVSLYKKKKEPPKTVVQEIKRINRNAEINEKKQN